jgi:hypothetical protein
MRADLRNHLLAVARGDLSSETGVTHVTAVTAPSGYVHKPLQLRQLRELRLKGGKSEIVLEDGVTEPVTVGSNTRDAVAKPPPIEVARGWSEPLARLEPNKPPGDVPPQRWVRFLDDLHAFLASDWPRRAAELSWSALDLFGCHPVAPYARHDRRGLVWSFGECGGGSLVAMTADTAVIERPTGSRQTFRRRIAACDAVLPWDLTT